MGQRQPITALKEQVICSFNRGKAIRRSTSALPKTTPATATAAAIASNLSPSRGLADAQNQIANGKVIANHIRDTQCAASGIDQEISAA